MKGLCSACSRATGYQSFILYIRSTVHNYATAYSEDKNCGVAAANTASPHVAVPLQLVNLAKGTCLVCSLSYGKEYTCY